VIDITPKHADSLYGLALSNFKLTRYSTAIPYIEKAIEYWTANESLTKIEQMIYFRGLCYKKTGDKVKCQKDYESLRPLFLKNLNQSLVSYVFGILMLPLQEERRLITNFVENFNELLIFYKNVAPVNFHDNRIFIS
jgi:tetratricopeptide (TPR) repeat protein